MRYKYIGVCLATLLGVSGVVNVQNDVDTRKQAAADDGVVQTYPVEPLAIGMNLSFLTDWNYEWVFVDVFRHSRDWIAQKPGGSEPWNTGEELGLNPDGWPILKAGQAAGTLMCRSLNGHYPSGSYTLMYQGTGKVMVGFDAKRIVRKGPNHFAAHVVSGDDGIYLRIDESDPKDPVRNIRFWMPGFEDVEAPFHPLFLERLRPFRVIRFMDWQRTNHSTVRRWSDRTTPESARQSGDAGVAIEYMIELCNSLGAHPWFCMPHLAEDHFVRSFAQTVLDGLNPDLDIYVEWSNEVWNTTFKQGRWVIDESKRQGVGRERVVAKEATRDWQIWREVFGNNSDRVIRVAAGHHHGPRFLRTVVNVLDGQFDALACSAYFHVPPGIWKTLDDNTAVDEVISAFEAGIREYDPPGIIKHRDLARVWSKKLGRHIPFIAYEGGPSYTVRGMERRFQKVLEQAQNDPRMYRLYSQWLRWFRGIGGELFVAYNYVGAPSRYGPWGHLAFQDESLQTSVKFRALLDAVEGYLPASGAAHVPPETDNSRR